MSFLNSLKGYRTYIVGCAMIVFALLGLALGKMDATTAGQIALNGAGLLGLRNAIANK